MSASFTRLPLVIQSSFGFFLRYVEISILQTVSKTLFQAMFISRNLLKKSCARDHSWATLLENETLPCQELCLCLNFRSFAAVFIYPFFKHINNTTGTKKVFTVVLTSSLNPKHIIAQGRLDFINGMVANHPKFNLLSNPPTEQCDHLTLRFDEDVINESNLKKYEFYNEELNDKFRKWIQKEKDLENKNDGFLITIAIEAEHSQHKYPELKDEVFRLYNTWVDTKKAMKNVLIFAREETKICMTDEELLTQKPLWRINHVSTPSGESYRGSIYVYKKILFDRRKLKACYTLF